MRTKFSFESGCSEDREVDMITISRCILHKNVVRMGSCPVAEFGISGVNLRVLLPQF